MNNKISSIEISKFFEDYFNQELNMKLDKTEKLKNIAEFDSLEVLNFLLAFEEKFAIKPKIELFNPQNTIEEIIKSLCQKPC